MHLLLLNDCNTTLILLFVHQIHADKAGPHGFSLPFYMAEFPVHCA